MTTSIADRLRGIVADAPTGVHQSIMLQAADEITRLRGTLQELRIRLHSSGRRPEECYEMSLIDEALRR